VKMLKKNKIFQSMSRKATCADNASMENFFGLLKQEMYYGEELVSYKELKSKIEEYIHWYNYERTKEKLVGLSPVEYRTQINQFVLLVKTLTLWGNHLNKMIILKMNSIFFFILGHTPICRFRGYCVINIIQKVRNEKKCMINHL